MRMKDNFMGFSIFFFFFLTKKENRKKRFGYTRYSPIPTPSETSKPVHPTLMTCYPTPT